MNNGSETENKNKGLHDGHRNRVKEEFLAHGFNKETPRHKILELLLFFLIPRIDTNEIAHLLLNRYKTIPAVLEAPVEELITFKGITRSNVVLFKLILEIVREYNDVHTKKEYETFNSYDDIGDYLLMRYKGLTEENFGVLCLKGRKFDSFEILEKGDIESVGVSTKKVIQHVLKRQATCAVIVHNHPNDIALPSYADVAITETLAIALKNIESPLIDHIIIAQDDYISMAQSNKYAHIFEK